LPNSSFTGFDPCPPYGDIIGIAVAPEPLFALIATLAVE
jgi:hypothetical protein